MPILYWPQYTDKETDESWDIFIPTQDQNQPQSLWFFAFSKTCTPIRIFQTSLLKNMYEIL